jgi:1-aminocyclopropane-1-carboxylate deaminase
MHPELIKLEKTFSSSMLTKVDVPLFAHYHIELWIKRDDLLHPVISGNKWRKLKYILNDALSVGAKHLISMGGAYSNHLHALAYLGQALNLKTTGLIRGERPEILTPTLIDMQNWGMELKFISRSDYRTLRHDQGWQAFVESKPDQYWLPEGGAQTLALKGVAELVKEIDLPYHTLCVPCGTGTTLAGLVNAVPESVSVLGIAALKNAGFLQADVAHLLPQQRPNWEINLAYHFGGFAKANAELIDFMTEFELMTHIPLEPVYTGKMLFALYALLKKDYFKAGQRIIAVHTGGLQGTRGSILLASDQPSSPFL